MAYGSQQKVVLIGEESTLGTAVVPDKDIGIVPSITDALQRELKDVESTGQRGVVSIERGMEEWNSTLGVELQHARIFTFAFGSVAHDDTDTPDIKHTFSFAEPSGFTLESSEESTTDTSLVIAGNVIESMELSIELNNVLTANITTKAISADSGSSAGSAALDTLSVFPHEMVEIGIDGNTPNEVQNFNITMENNVVFTGGVGSNEYQSSNITRTNFTFSGQLGFDAKTYQDIAVGTSKIPVYIDADNGVAAGSGKRQIYLSLQNCDLDTFNKITEVGDVVYVEISGRGELNECYSYDDITSANWL